VIVAVLVFLAAAPPGETKPSGAHERAAAPADPLASPTVGTAPDLAGVAPEHPSDADAPKPVDAVGALDEAARPSATPGTGAGAKLEPPLPEPPKELPPPSLGVGELLGQLVKMILMLGVVVGLAYLTLNKGLGKLVERQNLGKRVKVVERVALDSKRSLFLVDLDGKQLLLGAGEGGVVFIRDVEPAAPAPSPKSAGFADTLKRAVAGEPPVTTGLAKAVEDKTA
jgi:flagellar biogenesis protein FliO